MALGEHPEDAGDDQGLALVDGPVAAHRFAMRVGLPQGFIAIAQPASRFTGRDPAAEAAMRLGGEVLQEQRVHRALEADMQLGNLAFGKVTIFMPANLSRLYSPAISSWSRDSRSSASASTMSKPPSRAAASMAW